MPFKFITNSLSCTPFYLKKKQDQRIQEKNLFHQTLCSFRCESSDLFPKCFQLLFMGTEFFGAIGTAEIIVGIFGKPFRIAVECDLPAGKEADRQGQQGPGIGFCHKKQRREDHGIIPVIDTAGHTAFVFQEPGLERAEKQDADHIADRISTTQKQHDPVVKDPHDIKSSPDSIKTDPNQQDQDDGVVILDDDVRLAGFDIVPDELFLASGAFKF